MRLDYLSGGGPVPEGRPLYVERSADSDLFKSIQAGQLPYVCNARQMGKTILWFQSQKKLSEQDDSYCSVLIDINSLIPGKDCDARQWYYSFIDLLNYELKINNDLEILNDDGLNHFFDRVDKFLPKHSLTIFLQYLRKKSRYQKIVIGIDEIDQVLLFPHDIGIDFFKSIRSCYQENISSNSLQSSETQIGFVLIGVAAPYDLERNLQDDNKGTPFNLGVPIDLTGITPEKAVPVLSRGLESLVSSPAAVIDHILKLTGGQPFLTQKGCHLAKTAARRDTSVAEKSVEDLLSWTTDVIESKIIETAWTKDHGVHFRPIEDAIINDTPDPKELKYGRLLSIYERLYNGESVKDDGIYCIRLCLSGLTYSANGFLHIRSEIYTRVFNRAWIDRHVSELRERSGYLAALRAWEENNEEDIYLLTGDVLSDVEQRTTLSNLPDKDQRFLSLSQKQARNTAAMQEAEARQRLEIVKEQEAEARNQLTIVREQEAEAQNQLTIVEKRKQNAQRSLAVVSSLTLGALIWAGTATRQAITASRKEGEVSQSLQEKQADLNEVTSKVTKLEAQTDSLEDDVERLEGERSALKDSLDNAQTEITSVQGELKEEQNRLDAANRNLSETQDRLVTAEGDLTIANADLDEAITATEVAKDEAVIAQGQAKVARLEANDAEQKRQIAQIGTRLERAGGSVLQQFQFDPAGALIEATKIGLDLQKLVTDNGIVNLNDYPAASPLLVLRSVLDQIWQEPFILSGHQDGIMRIVSSKDGQFLATASKDFTARVWNNAGEELAILKGHQDLVFDVEFSPDNKIIATASRDGTARIWDLQGQELLALKGHQGTVVSVAFSPDGEKLITSDETGTARIWSFDGQEIAILRGHQDILWLAEFSPNGQYIATVSSDKTARIWSQDGSEIAVLEGHQGRVDDLTFSPNSELLATSSGRDIVARIWDVNGLEVARLEGHQGFIHSIDFSPDGEKLLTTSWDNTARIWNLDGQETATLVGNQNYVWSGGFTPDSQKVITAGWDDTARLWDLNGRELAIFQGHQSSLKDIVIDPQGRYFATASDDSTARIWSLEERQGSTAVNEVRVGPTLSYIDLQSGYVFINDNREEEGLSVWDFNGEKIALLSNESDIFIDKANVAFSPDTKKVAVARLGKFPRVWDLSTQTYVDLQGHESEISTITFSPDNQYIATSSLDHTARIWDSKGRELARLQDHQDKVLSVVFSPDGELIATASLDKTIRIWNRQGQQIAVFQGDEPYAYSGELLFSPDGEKIAAETSEGRVHIWDINQQRISAILQGHQYRLSVVKFSPDSQLVATGTAGAKIRIWDLNGREVAVLSNQSEEEQNLWDIVDIVFTQNNQQVIVASKDGLIKNWDIKSLDRLLIEGCQWLESYLPYREIISNADKHVWEKVAYLPANIFSDSEGQTISSSESMSISPPVPTVSRSEQFMLIGPEAQITPVSSSFPRFSASNADFYDRPRSYDQSIASSHD